MYQNSPSFRRPAQDRGSGRNFEQILAYSPPRNGRQATAKQKAESHKHQRIATLPSPSIKVLMNPYNTRRKSTSTVRASPVPLEFVPRKRVKRQSTYDFTPPPSPPLASGVRCYDEDTQDAIFLATIEILDRMADVPMCPREISEALLGEGKVQFSGNTPSTLINAAIYGHLKRCSLSQQLPLIDKVADPKYPRRTLYRLSAYRERTSMSEPSPTIAEQLPMGTMRFDAASRASTPNETDDEADELDPSLTLSNEGQGPFACPLEARSRITMSPSPELEFSLHIDEPEHSMPTPLTSQPTSPLRIPNSQTRLNIAAPPSPFRSGRLEVWEDDELGLPSTASVSNSPSVVMRDPLEFHDIFVDSPEQIGLDELDDIFGAYN